MFHLFRVNAVSLVSLAAKASCGGGVFGCVGFFLLVFWFLLGLVWFPPFCLCFFACLRSFTDWCTAHRQQSREQKKREAETLGWQFCSYDLTAWAMQASLEFGMAGSFELEQSDSANRGQGADGS